MLSFSDGKLYKHISSIIIEKLKEKYNKDFAVIAIANREHDFVVARCCPLDKKEDFFKVYLSKETFKDDYVESCICKEAQKLPVIKLREKGIKALLCFNLLDGQKALYGILVILDEGYPVRYIKDKVKDALKQLVEEFSTKVIVDVFVLIEQDFSLLKQKSSFTKSNVSIFNNVLEYRYKVE